MKHKTRRIRRTKRCRKIRGGFEQTSEPKSELEHCIEYSNNYIQTISIQNTVIDRLTEKINKLKQFTIKNIHNATYHEKQLLVKRLDEWISNNMI